MAGLQSAQARLEAAISRLEAAQDRYRRRIALMPGSVHPSAVPDGPGPDVQSLVSSLEDTQRENTELTDLTDQLAARLDSTIARLQRVIADAADEVENREKVSDVSGGFGG